MKDAATDREVLLLLARDVENALALLHRVATDITSIESRITDIEHQTKLNRIEVTRLQEQIGDLRTHDITQDTMVRGIGQSLDRLRSGYQEKIARVEGQLQVIGFLGGTLITIGVAVATAWITGYL